MLNSVVLDMMMGRLGRRQAVLMRSVCLQELNLAIRELERGPIKPWFLETTATGVTVADQGYVDLPTNFLMEVEEGVFEAENTLPNTGWIELVKVSRERIKEETVNDDPAFPEGYALWGNQILFGPVPDAVYNYRFDYYVRTSAIADNNSEADNPWITEFFNLTLYAALIVVARDHIQSDRMALNFTAAYKTAWDNFMRDVEARRVANETLLLTNEES